MALRQLNSGKFISVWFFTIVCAAAWHGDISGQTQGGDATASQPTSSPAEGQLDHPELRFMLLERYVDSVICSVRPPGFTKIFDESEVAPKFAEIQKDTIPFALIVQRLKMTKTKEFSVDQKVRVLVEYAKLRQIRLEPVGNVFQFHLLGFDRNLPVHGPRMFYFDGQIDGRGQITELNRRPQMSNPCPICLAGDAHIDTPNGAIAVKDLKPGDVVWTRDANGQKVAMPIVRTSAVPVPRDHHMVHLVMSDGRELRVSPGHPTIEGTVVGSLERDAIYDGAKVARAELVPYGGDFTYDILPTGETGFYWANGILLGSTLK